MYVRFAWFSKNFDRKFRNSERERKSLPEKWKIKWKQFVNNEVTDKPAGHMLGKFLNSYKPDCTLVENSQNQIVAKVLLPLFWQTPNRNLLQPYFLLVACLAAFSVKIGAIDFSIHQPFLNCEKSISKLLT